MAEEKDLVKKRGSFKGRLTIFINYLDALDGKALSSNDITELQLRVAKIESLYQQYDEVQLQLECIVEDIKTQFIERSDFESLYFKSLSRAQNLIVDFNKDNESVYSAKSTVRTSTVRPVKLPTIQLPKFNGSYNSWLEFRDTYTSLIHSNDGIDVINKFHYLRTSLEGSAAVVIQAIEFSATNYSVAWQVLCERFDNKKLLIHNHVSAIFNIEPITKESSGTLKGLIDQLNKNLRALETLGEPVKHWDTLLIYIVTRKLDIKTFREWEECKGRVDKDSNITFDTFLQFMRNRADLVETLELSRNNQSQVSNKSGPKLKSMVAVQSGKQSDTEVSATVCPKCKGNHNLSNCAQFLALSNEARMKLLPSYKVCYNCLRSGHFANHCKRPGCKLCKRKHNTLVHLADANNIASISVNNSNNNSSDNLSARSPSTSATSEPNNVALSANITSSCGSITSDVLLSTALVKIRDVSGSEHVVRAVLDSGSTSSFVTERLCKRLCLEARQVDRSILGINNVISHVGKTCRVRITSLNNCFTADMHCFILPSITNNVPCREINISALNIPSHICLADPTFYKPADIDVLIGADVFWDILESQSIKLGKGKPILCETRLGWIVSGPISHSYATLLSSNIRCNFTKIDTYHNDNIDQLRSDLARFWQLEEVGNKSSHYSPEERLCEEHYVKNTTRLQDGRFCVRIPLKQSPSLLGDSIKRATHCLHSLERRLKAKPDFGKMYNDFMSEYESLGHMTAFTLNSSPSGYFIPHHGVLREGSSTTKLRVVFNASCPSSSGVSSNDLQMVGPTIQDDLLSILLRFRQYKYVISADVEKMYRQIIVHPSDRYLQQIVWHERSTDSLRYYKLNTVTYGTASAPFLAFRCLHQVGLDCKNDKVADVIKHDFYADDLLSGGDDLNEVRFIRDEVTKALASAHMPLRKWKSNEPQLLTDVAQSSLDLNILCSSEPTKLLGLGWHASSDELVYSLDSTLKSCPGNTKRDLLSVIARIFDPLGLLAPFVITLKMILQKMWLDKLSWDEPLTSEVSSQWQATVKALPLLNSYRIPRIIVCHAYKEVELHIFTDASERAYGACAYIRSINDNGECLVRLVMAKSRVAPIKPTTIPRLELCGAVVGTRLCEKVSRSLRWKFNRTFCWTDSTIVLGWLQMLPSKLQPFVRNRVAEILDQAGHCSWRHVPTDKNPADLISRGMSISNLQGSDLWWSGPDFLQLDSCLWPSHIKSSKLDSLPEIRPNVSLNAVYGKDKDYLIDYERFSNYSRLLRAMAYALKFIKISRGESPSNKLLSSDELRQALNVLIYNSQRESFPEHQFLLNKQDLPKKSALLKFNVYLDNNNLIRVGGRLDNSDFSYNKRHPILLQSSHNLTKLIFNFEHRRLMHAGPQQLLASIRESYWPIGGRNLAKVCYRKCILCNRMKGKVVAPLMGNLPRQRLLPGGYPFESTGVDYAGPIMCASRQGRGCRLVKVYIAIFICFTTKAVHLELVGDLTSHTYLLALYRFISRRGKPSHIYSDNGTSFVGAYNELSKFLKLNSTSISSSVANDGISFHFIPAYSPHFGGLWEAGVKSAKYHLQRVLGNCNLTFEHLYTTLVQIEAILNSRPLTPLSSDPADCTPLTPGHFLVGRPLTALPQDGYEDHTTTHLSRYQRIEQLRQHFWQRWSKEYVAELQLRTKWRSCKGGLKLDSLVVVKEENLPPLKWRLGRVVGIHPGSDGIVRVADIKTSAGVIRRAFNKICPLPVTKESESG